MKLNLSYFTEEMNEEITPKEQEIISNYIEQYTESQYEEILKKDMSLETVYALSNHRKNIINWYDFHSNASILEVGAHLGEVTGELCKKLRRVVAIESSKKRAEAMAKRHNDKENLEVIVGNMNDIKLDETFDYILLYEVNLLPFVKPYTKSNTIILLATDNRFGITYFAGAKHENSQVYETILGNTSKVFSKYEIEEMIKQEGYTKYQFYYPLPNYKMPNVIFSDKYLPRENTTKLMYNILYPKGSVVTFDELRALKQLTKSKEFPMFANSYFIEIVQKETTTQSDICFISYNNKRTKKYQLITKIYSDKVIKEPIDSASIEHVRKMEINNKNLEKLGFCIIDNIEEDRIVSPYIKADTLDKVIANEILKNHVEKAYQLIDLWYEEIRKKLHKDKKSKLNEKIPWDRKQKIKELTILKNGYIDLVFENVFYQDGKMLFFDQEWCFIGMPLEFILYRAIQNLYAYNVELQNHLPQKEILEKYGLIPYMDLFHCIETYIQTEVIESYMEELNTNSLNQLIDAKYVSVLHNQLEDFKANDKRQNDYIRALEEDNRKKQEYIEALEEIKKIKR